MSSSKQLALLSSTLSDSDNDNDNNNVVAKKKKKKKNRKRKKKKPNTASLDGKVPDPDIHTTTAADNNHSEDTNNEAKAKAKANDEGSNGVGAPSANGSNPATSSDLVSRASSLFPSTSTSTLTLVMEYLWSECGCGYDNPSAIKYVIENGGRVGGAGAWALHPDARPLLPSGEPPLPPEDEGTTAASTKHSSAEHGHSHVSAPSADGCLGSLGSSSKASDSASP
eukprot:CAMPEP_0182456080 /NCGR_PEP_ID=MMETSP1319-20130603/2027_1 /TAXON_ID=172717 /ORGANISM="Bolidomonas pacifica, Strain RCC208" /LENGTH=224 /DNA_ID=CAMNT_0024654255 /DNA_START=196 /DNA_END=867 /DNA_ORIENTATION=-